MLTYQVRERALVPNRSGERLSFPNDGEVRFALMPAEPFGGAHGPSRTAVLGVKANLAWNANTDRDSVTPEKPLEPIVVESQADGIAMRVHGNELSVSSHFRSHRELVGLMVTVHFGLPLVLGLQYVDVPVVTMVTGQVGGVEFVWQYAKRAAGFTVTTKELQEEHFLRAWERLEMLLPLERRRLFAALHYLHTACRLERAGVTPWEFMAEVLLNFSKVLEVLFPAQDEKTIESARAGLERLTYTPDEIEQWFIPAIALRNHLDVAHVSLAAFPQRQLRVLHDYTEQAEAHFRELLERVLDGIARGTFDVPAYTDRKPGGEAEKIIRRMAKHFPEK